MRDRLRTVRLGRFTLSLFATERTDSRGCTGIAWTVRQDGRPVASSTGGDLVFGSPLHADDSDATVAAAVSLIAHCATHDENDNRIPCVWDADAFSDEGAMRFGSD